MCETEYYQYLNKIWSECLTAAAEDKKLATVFFDKAASPEYYWKQNTGQTTNERQRAPNNNPATEKQKKALFVITHDKTDGKWLSNDKFNKLPCEIDDMTIDQASDFIDKYGKA